MTGPPIGCRLRKARVRVNASWGTKREACYLVRLRTAPSVGNGKGAGREAGGVGRHGGSKGEASPRGGKD